MNKKAQQSGQALLIVIFAITLGLVALVGVSTRIVNSTKRVFVDNAYYKAQAVAEAGAEKFLWKKNSELDNLIFYGCKTSLYNSTGFDEVALNTHPNCVIDLGEARAVMAVETYPSAGVSIYEVSSPANSTISVNLAGVTGDIRVCWRAGGLVGSEYSEVLSFYYFKKSIGSYQMQQQKNVCGTFISWCHKPIGYSTSDAVPANGASGPDYACFTIIRVPTDTPQLLNLMSLVNGSSYKITFTGTVPTQGYKITSVGEVKSGATGGGSLASSTATRKKVMVEKSRMPNLGPWFNFAVASESGKITTQ